MVATAATSNRFTEITAASSAVRVDAENGVLYGVKLLGLKSRNGREYTEQAARNAVPLYVGRKVYLNHPRPSDRGADRPFQDWVGVISNPRYESDGVYGDITLRKESSHYNEIIEAARRWSNSFGCSHIADGDSDFRNGVEVVNRIKEVFSVDLVTDPATTGGLFESSPYAAVKHGVADSQPTNPLEVIEHEVDAFTMDALYAVCMANSGDSSSMDSPATLSDISARLHVLANELRRWAGDSMNPGTPGYGTGPLAPLNSVVASLDNIFLNPRQPSAVVLVEPLLVQFAQMGTDAAHPNSLGSDGTNGAEGAGTEVASLFAGDDIVSGRRSSADANGVDFNDVDYEESFWRAAEERKQQRLARQARRVHRN